MESNILKQAREAAGLTQVQVAEAMHVVPATVSRWESGSRKIGVEEMKTLARLLGVSYDYFLGINDVELSLNLPATRADIKKIEDSLEEIKELLKKDR